MQLTTGKQELKTLGIFNLERSTRSNNSKYYQINKKTSL